MFESRRSESARAAERPQRSCWLCCVVLRVLIWDGCGVWCLLMEVLGFSGVGVTEEVEKTGSGVTKEV